MTTSTLAANLATITVPAAYLEDFRTAALSELEDDCQVLKINQDFYLQALHPTGRWDPSKEFVPSLDASRGDRDASITDVRTQAALLEQLPVDEVDGTVCAAKADLTCTLVLLGRLWTKQLATAWDGYEPEDISDAAALVDRLRWCVDQAEAVA